MPSANQVVLHKYAGTLLQALVWETRQIYFYERIGNYGFNGFSV